MTGANTSRKILSIQAAGFTVLLILIWLNEFLDFPHLLFQARRTHINWKEAAFESGLIIALAVFSLLATRRLLRTIRRLEGILPVCSFCKKIRNDSDWVPIEEYISKHSDAAFTHGVCPECARKHYSDLLDQKSPPPGG